MVQGMCESKTHARPIVCTYVTTSKSRRRATLHSIKLPVWRNLLPTIVRPTGPAVARVAGENRHDHCALHWSHRAALPLLTHTCLFVSAVLPAGHSSTGVHPLGYFTCSAGGVELGKGLHATRLILTSLQASSRRSLVPVCWQHATQP